MKIRKRNRTGGRILTLLLSCCLLAGFVPEVKASPVGTDEGDESGLVLDKWVEEAEDGNFKLTLESYATGSDGTVTTEPLPLDIVLVLDESGSMALSLGGCDDQVDVAVTLRGHLLESNDVDFSDDDLDKAFFTGHKVFANDLDTEEIYTIVNPAAKNTGDATRTVSYCKTCEKWRSSHIDHNDHEIPGTANWAPFSEQDEGSLPQNTDEDEYEIQFYELCDGVTGQELLQDAVSGFLTDLQADDADNRVAIVGYGMGSSYIHPDGERKEVYQSNTYVLSSESDALAEAAWHNVKDLEEGDIDTWVSTVRADGTTCTHVGIQAAELAFANIPETEDGHRSKVMILFTDSVPGVDSITYGPDRTDGRTDWITPGIESAYTMKQDDVTIYTVGLFPYADGYNADVITYDPMADGNLNDADDMAVNEDFYQYGNCFLHLVSFNYPNATGVYADEHGERNPDYSEEAGAEKSYYLGTEDANDLSDIFEQLSASLPGSTTVTLDEESVVKDDITEDFQIVDGSNSVTAWTESYEGVDSDGTTRWEQDPDSVSIVADANTEGKLHITVDGQTVEVTNFDFAEHFVHMDENNQPAGKKLVIEILIQPTEDTPGGTKLPTNESGAGVYGNENPTTPAAEFPLPHVDLPATVTIQKVVEESESTETFSFEAEYVAVEKYENLTAEESGGANDGNYLQLTESTSKTAVFTLGNGDTQTLEDVEAGSSLTIREDAGKGWIPTVTTSTGTTPLEPDGDGKYTVEVISGMVITFTNVSETTTVRGSKTWDDADNQNGKRAESITIRLYADGTEVGSRTVTAEDGWEWSFTNLPKYAGGEEIIYTITEDTVTDYTTSYDGYNVTNTYAPGKTSVTVTKNWQDDYDQDDIRPDSITVKLLADEEDTGKTLTLSESNHWMGSFAGLDKYVDGAEIEYTIEEVEVNGYDSAITGDASIGFTITNSHTPDSDEPDPDRPDPNRPDPDEPDPNRPDPDEPDPDRPDPDEPVSGEPEQPEKSEMPKDDVPQTGDPTNLTLWTSLLAVSGTGLFVTLVFGKKKRYRGKRYRRKYIK